MKLSRRGALALIGSAACGACAPAPSPAGRPLAEVPTATATHVPPTATATQVPPTATPGPAATPTLGTAATVVATVPPAVEPTVVYPAEPTATPTSGGVLAGVDVLMRERTGLLSGRRLGLVTNTTGRDGSGRSSIDVLHAESSWQLVALFSPEHGIRGDADAGASVASSVDSRTGLPIYSLYGATTRPTAVMLRGIDTLVYDIQDVGCRTYTYVATLLEVLRAGAEHGRAVVVLDRPNPLGGVQVEGNVLDPGFASFVGPAALAMRYGLTIGELAQWLNGELGLGADLTVVPLRAWGRQQWFDQTGLAWVDPSPNIRSLSAAALYPGIVLVEGTNLSEGRGTDRPFEWIGAPWLDGGALSAVLNEQSLGGVRFSQASRTPDASKFSGQVCQGVGIEITEREALRPMALGVAVLAAVRSGIGGRLQFAARTFDGLAGTDAVRKALEAGEPAAQIVAGWEPSLATFSATRAKYLLY